MLFYGHPLNAEFRGLKDNSINRYHSGTRKLVGTGIKKLSGINCLKLHGDSNNQNARKLLGILL